MIRIRSAPALGQRFSCALYPSYCDVIYDSFAQQSNYAIQPHSCVAYLGFWASWCAPCSSIGPAIELILVLAGIAVAALGGCASFCNVK
jgi:hypothetical protein